MATDLQNPATLYAGTGAQGVFKSLNGGYSWTAINTGLPNNAISALVVDPRTPTVLYAGISPYGGQGGGVYKSTNGGGSWSPANAGLTLPLIVGVLAIDPLNPMTVYADTNRGMAKSIDGGTTWIMLTSRQNLENWGYGLAIDPEDPTTLYAVTVSRRLAKSIDGGFTWRYVTPESPGPAPTDLTEIRSIAIDPKNPVTVYAGANAGIIKSTNGGDSWSPIITGLTLVNMDKVVALTINPQDPATLYALVNHESNVPFEADIIKSTDGGASWKVVNAGLPQHFPQYYHVEVILALAIDPHDPTAVYAGTRYNGVFVSGAMARVPLGVPAGGTASSSTLGPTDELVSGYVTVTVNAGSAPYGTAVFSYTLNGYFVSSEAGVPVSPPMRALP